MTGLVEEFEMIRSQLRVRESAEQVGLRYAMS